MRAPVFLYNNLLDVASLYPTSENAELPATNLQHRFRTKVFEVASPISDVVIDFAEEKPITAIALIDYDWQAIPNSLFVEFSTDSFNAASGQTQELTFRANPTSYGNPGAIIKTFTLNSSYRYARFRVNADSIWQAGRLYLGTYFEPSLGMLHAGYRFQLEDDSKMSKSVGGQEHIDEIDSYRTARMRFVIKAESQLNEFYQMFSFVGRRKDFFVALDYTNEPSEYTLYGKFAADMKIQRPGPYHWSLALSFREVR